jgi:hypothetical protein
MTTTKETRMMMKTGEQLAQKNHVATTDYLRKTAVQLKTRTKTNHTQLKK